VSVVRTWRVPKQHSVTKTGAEDLIFLVIYDPPNTDGTP
jgi:hypothetical protein